MSLYVSISFRIHYVYGLIIHPYICYFMHCTESVPSDQDLPSDSIESHATTEGSNGPSDEMEPANQGSAENDETEQSEGEDIAEQDVPTRPQRQRRPPQILTYDSLGNPQYQCVEPVVSSSFVNSIQAPVAAAIHPGAPLFISGCGHAAYNLPTTRGHERNFI